MQPFYMPWAGFFNLIFQTDHFIFLDDAQYQKSSWQNRNRLLANGLVSWLSIPVRKQLGTSIIETEIDSRAKWQTKHPKTIAQAYARYPHAQDLEPLLNLIKSTAATSLADVNIESTKLIASKLEISSTFYRSSELNIQGSRTERLVRLCNHVSSGEYLSPEGSREYLMQDGNFNNSGVKLLFQDFNPAIYDQAGNSGKFISHLSIIDVVANLGWEEASKYVSEKYNIS
jgi:hypothetical protein